MAVRQGGATFHVVLLAGGSGTRFWPLSRSDRPKQFLPLTGARPLLLETWRRVRGLAPARRIWVVAPERLAPQVRKMLPGLGRRNLILEPSPRDTGPAVALACETISRREARAVVGVFPTDHVIGDRAAFLAALRVAVKRAERGALVCLGVRPDRPATGFGYLQCRVQPRIGRAVLVERFVEKPDALRARRFLRSGRYLWNAGMFVWGVDRFLLELGRTEPSIRSAVRGYVEGRTAAWPRAPKLSVDYAVMEKADGVEVVPLDAGWDDVGSWDAAARLRRSGGRRRAGRDVSAIVVDSPGSAVFGNGRLVALVDVPDVVVVDTEEATLVVARGQTEKVRKVVAELRRRRREDLL